MRDIIFFRKVWESSTLTNPRFIALSASGVNAENGCGIGESGSLDTLKI